MINKVPRTVKTATQRLNILIVPKIMHLAYVVRLILDQPGVKRRSSSDLIFFSRGKFPKLGMAASDFTAQAERQKNLDIVIDCLEAEEIEYFVIPNTVQGSYKVGIQAKDKKKFIENLRKRYDDTGVYIAAANKYTNDLNLRQILSSKKSPKILVQDTNALCIYRFVLSPDLYVLAGDEVGCVIEFWERSDNKHRLLYLKNKLVELRVNTELSLLKNTLIAPAENLITGIIPLDEVKVEYMHIGEKKYRTYDVFNKNTIYDIDFPIDVVYSWVDGSDPKWKAKFNKFKGITENASDRNNTESRYIDRQELKYSLRSLHMYAPWVRNIYIVTDGQVPDWLDQSIPGVRIVDHKDIFYDSSVLPVFNSHAIGAQIHHIKGLSDRYLYLNDDMMFGREIRPHNFFFANGIAKVFASPALIHAGSPKNFEPAPSSAGKNVRKALEDSFGRHITHKFKHAPNPQIKEVAFEIENKYSDIVKRTISSRFRSKNDVQFASMFHHSYSLITGKAVIGNMKLAVVNISHESAGSALNELLKSRSAYTICLNESETAKERYEAVEEMVHKFFESYFPYPSPWEKRTNNPSSE